MIIEINYEDNGEWRTTLLVNLTKKLKQLYIVKLLCEFLALIRMAIAVLADLPMGDLYGQLIFYHNLLVEMQTCTLC